MPLRQKLKIYNSFCFSIHKAQNLAEDRVILKLIIKRNSRMSLEASTQTPFRQP
jgi:hypothetical protein